MDRENQPPSILSGQLKLGLMEEGKKETLLEEISAFAGAFLVWAKYRLATFLAYFLHFALSGFTLSSQLKFWLSRKFVRQKGQLSFPFAHATLVGLSLSLLVTTGGLGEFIYEKTSPVISEFGASVLESAPQLVTEESKLLRKEAVVYVVREGEDVYAIAKKFHIPADALVYANRPLPYPFDLAIGRELTIPPFQGLVHEVDRPFTVKDLARAYGADPQDIIDFNYLFPSEDGVYRLAAGQVVIVPTYAGEGFLGGTVSPKGECGKLSLGWPSAQRQVNQYWRPWHQGVDINAGYEELFAASPGTVVGVGSPASWNQGYGGSVFINVEGTGYQIRYAHMSRVSVGVGQKINGGAVIGISGSTGKAFGAHLHFELLCNGEKIDPYYYLPR